MNGIVHRCKRFVFLSLDKAVNPTNIMGDSKRFCEIFALNVGESAKINTLIRNMIRLAGFLPGIDIVLSCIGLKSGEKLYEEKLMAEEGLKKTKNELIHIGCSILFDIE